MAVARWNDVEEVGEQLAARGLPGLLSIDFEGRTTISAVGAVRSDRSSTYAWRGDRRGLSRALRDLDEFAAGAACLVGYNIIEHDLPMLAEHAPHLELLDLPAIDTLYLSPLARPENPYHLRMRRTSSRPTRSTRSSPMTGNARFSMP